MWPRYVTREGDDLMKDCENPWSVKILLIFFNCIIYPLGMAITYLGYLVAIPFTFILYILGKLENEK